MKALDKQKEEYVSTLNEEMEGKRRSARLTMALSHIVVMIIVKNFKKWKTTNLTLTRTKFLNKTMSHAVYGSKDQKLSSIYCF